MVRSLDSNVSTHSLKVWPLVHSQKGREIARQASRRFLIACISQNVRKVRELEYSLFFQRRQFEFHLQASHAEALEEVWTDQSPTGECKERQKRKFNTLLNQSSGGPQPRHPNDRWMVNLLSRPLSVVEKGVLARGLNLAPAPKRIPVPEIIAAVESGISKVSPSEAQLTRTRIAGCLSRSKPPPNNLSPEEQKAIKALREAETIVIAPADKGNATVIMDQTAYDGKIRGLLADTSTCRRLTRDPTQDLERWINALLLSLSRVGAIPGPLYEQLRSSAGKIPLLYRLPKVHKPGIPLRPIVSFINSPTYQLSKHLVSILTPFVGMSDSHVRNSAQFATFIAGQVLPSGTVLV